MSPRFVLLMTGIAALFLYGWVAIEVYDAATDPERLRDRRRPAVWRPEPPSAALEEAARRHLNVGLARLNDTSAPPAERLATYREELRSAEELLIRSLRARPLQARGLAELAAVRWELDPPLTEPATAEHLALVALASRMAPTAPTVQMRLGELLLKMGRRDEAVDYLSRTIELDPHMSAETIRLLREHLFSFEEILAALPRRPAVLAGLERPAFEDGAVSDYVAMLDSLLGRPEPAPSADLLVAFGRACVRLDEPGRLRDRMTSLGDLPDAETDAARLQQRARAHLALGETAEALDDARRAHERTPESPASAEFLGDIAHAAGAAERAVRAHTRALGLVARGSGSPRVRARLYRKIGQAEEAGGEVERAYDAYKMALQLDPSEPIADRRITEMERAAGIR